MAEASIPVDLRNPGQVFACLGLMEAAEVLHPDPHRLRREPVTGHYHWEDDAVRARFVLSAPGVEDPMATVIDFLTRASVMALNHPGGAPLERQWKVEESVVRTGETFVPPAKPNNDGFVKSLATLPIKLYTPANEIIISHWGDPPQYRANNVKLWAGSGGKPGAKLAIEAVGAISSVSIKALVSDPFNFSAPQSSSFNFEMRRIAPSLDVGISLDAHKDIDATGYPLVEIFAAIGLSNARPQVSSKTIFRYAVSDMKLPLIFARPVLGCADIGFPLRSFKAQLRWLGPEDKSARCIKDSVED